MKATFASLVLLFDTRLDPRSWLYALDTDLQWLQACDAQVSFDVATWFDFARSAPKAARLLVR